MVEISLSGSGEGRGTANRGYSTDSCDDTVRDEERDLDRVRVIVRGVVVES
jgi:hypothetical protein